MSARRKWKIFRLRSTNGRRAGLPRPESCGCQGFAGSGDAEPESSVAPVGRPPQYPWVRSLDLAVCSIRCLGGDWPRRTEHTWKCARPFATPTGMRWRAGVLGPKPPGERCSPSSAGDLSTGLRMSACRFRRTGRRKSSSFTSYGRGVGRAGQIARARRDSRGDRRSSRSDETLVRCELAPPQRRGLFCCRGGSGSRGGGRRSLPARGPPSNGAPARKPCPGTTLRHQPQPGCGRRDPNRSTEGGCASAPIYNRVSPRVSRRRSQSPKGTDRRFFFNARGLSQSPLVIAARPKQRQSSR